MSRKLYLAISGIVFCLVAILHMLRVFFDWPFEVAGQSIPAVASWAAMFVAAGLAAWAFGLMNQER